MVEFIIPIKVRCADGTSEAEANWLMDEALVATTRLSRHVPVELSRVGGAVPGRINLSREGGGGGGGESIRFGGVDLVRADAPVDHNDILRRAAAVSPRGGKLGASNSGARP